MSEKNIAGAKVGSGFRRGVTCLSALTICCLAAVEAKAGLFTITSANTHVSMIDPVFFGAPPTIPDNTSITSAVHTLVGGDDFPAWSSSLSTAYEAAKIGTEYTLNYPDSAASDSSSLLKGTTTVNFIANENLKYSLHLGSSFVIIGGQALNSRSRYKLTDVTNNTLVVEAMQEKWNNVTGSSFDGNPFGSLVAGNSYRWESSFESSNNFVTGFGNLSQPGSASVAFTVIPEPSALAFLGLGAFGLIRRR